MKVGVIGLGLIGGSFAKTLKKNDEYVVYGYDIDENTLSKAKLVGAIDDDLTVNTAKEIDLLIIAVNPDKFYSAIKEFLPLLKKGATVIDFCGTKRTVVSKMHELKNEFKDLIFLGGHPMAGREFSGFDRSTSTLFNKASMILVNVNADIFKLEEIKKFFISLGFLEVVFTTAENHDRLIAFTSQLCHIVSNAFIKNKISREHFGYSAGSYKDLTRVARLDSNMWSKLMIENCDNLSSELDELIENLKVYSTALKNKNEEDLRLALKEGNDIKIEIDAPTSKLK